MTRRKRSTPVTDFRLVPVDAAADRRRRRRLAGVAVFLLLLGALVGAGGYHLLLVSKHANHQSKRLDALQQRVKALRQRLVVYQTDHSIDDKARLKVKQQYQELQGQLAELRQAVGFYKKLMAPGSRKQGLYIEQLSISPLAHGKADSYRFHLVLTQVGNNKWRPYLKGAVSWQLKGLKQGKPVTLAQGQFVAADSDASFRFRYFQELKGRLTLPAQVTPKTLVVTAVSKGQRAYRVKHTYQWTQVEHNKNGTS